MNWAWPWSIEGDGPRPWRSIGVRVELQPDDAQVNCNLAWLRASCAEPSLRNGAEAVALARRAVELTGGQNPIVFAALAAAQAEAGQFPEAVAAGRQGVNLALQQDNPAAAKVLQRSSPCTKQESRFAIRRPLLPLGQNPDES